MRGWQLTCFESPPAGGAEFLMPRDSIEPLAATVSHQKSPHHCLLGTTKSGACVCAMCTCTCVYMCARMCHVHLYTCPFVLCARVHACTCVLCACVHMCACVCVWVCMHVCTRAGAPHTHEGCGKGAGEESVEYHFPASVSQNCSSFSDLFL